MKTRSKSNGHENSKLRFDINKDSNSSVLLSGHTTSDKSENQSGSSTGTLDSNRKQSIDSNARRNSSEQDINQHLLSTTVESTNKSSVWLFGTKLPQERCQCNKCGKVLSRKNFSTSSLRKHLSQCIGREEFLPSKTKKSNNTQQLDPERIRKLNELAYECIIKDSRSFNDLRKPGIKKLIEQLLPGYIPPVRQTVQRQLKRLMIKHSKNFYRFLSKIPHVAVTCDFWTDKKMRSYLCLTVHYVHQGRLFSNILSFDVFNGRHDNVNIAEAITIQLKRYNIFEKCTTITCDGVSNIKKSFLHLPRRRLNCIAHKLHLVICNGLCLWVCDKKKKGTNTTPPLINSDKEEEEAATALTTSLQFLSFEDFISNEEQMETESNDSKGITFDAHDTSEEEDDVDLDGDVEQDYDGWTEGIVYDESLIECNEQDSIRKCIYKCRELIKMIRKTTILTSSIDQWKKDCNVKSTLNLDIRSRWNSTLFLVETVIDHRMVIIRLMAEKYDLELNKKQTLKLTDLEITKEEWMLLRVIQQALDPFCKATRMISGQKYSTVGLSYFALSGIREFLEDQKPGEDLLNKLKRLLLTQMDHYFDNDHNQWIQIKFLSYFDPLGYGCLSRHERLKIEHEIKTMIQSEDFDSSLSTSTGRPSQSSTSTIERSSESTTSTTGRSSTSTTGPSSQSSTSTKGRSSASNIVLTCQTEKRLNVIQGFLDSIGKQQSNANIDYGDLSLNDEMVEYKTLATKEYSNIVDGGKKPDAIEFWYNNARHLKILYKLAMKNLITPATSVPSEQAFSVAAHIGRKQRARLSPQNLSMTVFLRDKLNHVDVDE